MHTVHPLPNAEMFTTFKGFYVCRAEGPDTKEGKTNTDDFEKTKKDFITANSYELVDPIKILDKINTLEESIASFKAEVDAALSTSNAVTEIEISY